MKYIKTALELFGKSIKIAMEERNTNINSLAEVTGLSTTTISIIVNGDKTYSIDSYIKLARALQIHIEFSLMSIDNNVHTMGGKKPNIN